MEKSTEEAAHTQDTSKEVLQRAHNELERLVEERTAELAQANANLKAEIAERKRTEATLRESEERFNRLSEATFEGIGITDKGKVIDVNNQLAKMLGYEASEIIGKNAMDCVAPESRDLVLNKIMSGHEGPYEHLALRKDGSTFPVEVRAKTLPYQGRLLRVTAIRDITNHKRAEEEIHRRNRELSLLNQVIAATTASLEPEAILETVCRDLVQAFGLSQGVAVLVNEEKTAVTVIAEYQLEDQPSIIGQSIPITNNPFIEHLIAHRAPLAVENAQNDPRLASIYHLLRCRSAISVLMFPLIVKDEIIGGLSLGATKPRSFSPDEISLVQSVGEQVAGALARAYLDREHRQLQEQYYQAQKMEAVGRLTAGIAHDFNNLLTVINGFATLMKYQIHAEDPLRDELDKILTSGERAADLVRQLLAFSSKQVIEPRVLDLNTAVAKMDKMLQRIIGEDILLQTYLAPDLWLVQADPAQIEQIIVNLAVNARDAMPHGGRLTIETNNVVLESDYAAHHLETQPGEYMLLTISDTGHGMAAEVQAHIFEPFYTTKEVGKGTGLGLATAFGIIKQNNGHIWVYSELGQGTTFKIYLPRAKEAIPVPSQREPADELLRGTETILLVEDDFTVRELAVRILHRQGYRLLEAANGDEALRLSREYEGEIHLLLTDMVMPKMGGEALVDQFRTFFPNAKVLFMSGYTDKTIMRNGELEPDIAFISKPFSPTGLARKVRIVLDGL